MSEDMLATLQAIDPVVLAEVVRQDQRSTTFEITEWTVKRLSDKGIINPDGLFLFSGQGRDERGTRLWSVVLKVLKDPSTQQKAHDFFYWKREALAVQSGLLANMPSHVVTPRFYGVTEHESAGWLWMEHIVESISPRWTLDHYAIVARELGRSDGAYLTGTPIPDYPWLCKGFARTWANALVLHSAWDNPFTAQAFSSRLQERVLQLWDERQRFCDALDQLPQVFSHFDFQRRNLFIRHQPDGRQEVVAIDWAQCGYGALGGGLYTLVGVNAILFEVEPETAPELENSVFEAYLTGLCEAGWYGNPELVRLGYTALLALFIGMGAAPVTVYWTSEKMLPQINRQFRCSPERFVAGAAAICEFALDRGDEARQLMDRLGF